MSYREAILSGAKHAEGYHQILGTKKLLESSDRSNVDVFGSILKAGACLLFRPLDGLLGACIENRRGVIISTQRPLAVQRFTGAHELGHVIMNHPVSLDGVEILSGDMPKTTDDMEVEANAFAADFLLPRWLLAYHAKRQGWGKKEMKDPLFVYQLSLRLGASYEATVRSLERYQIIDTSDCASLLGIQPKRIKQGLLSGYSPTDWFRDVWLISERDEGMFVEGQPGDLFIFRLNEKSGAGYLWDFETLKQKGFIIENDERQNLSITELGAPVMRTVTVHSPREQIGAVNVQLRRPWQSDGVPASHLRIKYNLLGKEIGLPRSARPQLAVAA
jgi:Zn-dependent peptidase ImmA (M78 family)